MLTAALLALVSAAGDDFDARFTGKTVRFSFEHCGTAAQEQVAPERFRLEGDWPGSRTQLVDALGYGKYRFLVKDPASGATLHSRGYCSRNAEPWIAFVPAAEPSERVRNGRDLSQRVPQTAACWCR